MNRVLSMYMKEVSKFPTLTKEEEMVLIKKFRNGNREALNKLIKSNLRFVISIAKRYRNQGVPFSDLISTGNIGLIEAMRRYDETKGVKFVSYAVHWVRQSILSLLANQSKIVRIPLNQAGLMIKISRSIEELEKQNNKKPVSEEIANDLSIRVSDIDYVYPIYTYPEISLDEPVYCVNGCKVSVAESVSAYLPSVEDIHNDAYRNEVKEKIYEVLCTLPKRDAEIIRLYYGIDAEKPHTLEEIGVIFNLSRERVRQIKERAMKKLKHISRKNKLKELYKAEAIK